MGAPKSRRQKLLPEHMNVVSHWKLHHLVMEMSNGSGDVAARRDVQCRVLNDLKAINGRGRGVRGPNWSRIIENRLDERLEGG